MYSSKILSLDKVQFLALIIVCLVSQPGIGGCDSITAKMLQEDPRLSVSVSLDAPRIYLGDLVDRLSVIGRVDVTAGERDGTSDAIVAVFLHDAPLFQVMDCLWSLLSYKNAEYSWHRDVRDAKFVYRLTRPLAAQRLAEAMRTRVQGAFEAEAGVMQAALTLSPRELKQLAKKDERVAGLIASNNQSEGLRTFFGHVSDSDQRDVLRGERILSVPVSALSDRARAFVHKTWKDYNGVRILPNGSREPIQEPTSVTFYASTKRQGIIAPSMFINIEGIGANGYLGGVPLELKVDNEVRDMWLLPGDARTDGADKQRITIGDDKEITVGVTGRDQILKHRLAEISKSARVSVMARLPQYNRKIVDPGRADKQVLNEYLARMTEPDAPPYLIHKWRSGTLLISHVGWYLEPDPAPWRLAGLLASRLKAQNGRLSVKTLIEMAGKLSSSELESLSSEYPPLGAVAKWHPLFYRLASSSALTKLVASERGVPIADVADAMNSIQDFATVLKKPEAIGGSLRLIDSDEHDGMILVKVFSPVGKDLGGAGFANRKVSTD